MKEYKTTIARLAEDIASRINLEDPLDDSEWPNASFEYHIGISTADTDDVDGWYGLHAIDAGFDSENLILVFDYYGGNCFDVLEICSAFYTQDVLKRELERCIIKLLWQEVTARSTPEQLFLIGASTEIAVAEKATTDCPFCEEYANIKSVAEYYKDSRYTDKFAVCIQHSTWRDGNLQGTATHSAHAVIYCPVCGRKIN